MCRSRGQLGTVAELADEAERTTPENVKARTPVGVEVSPAGVGAGVAERAEQQLLERYPLPQAGQCLPASLQSRLAADLA